MKEVILLHLVERIVEVKFRGREDIKLDKKGDSAKTF